VSRALLALAAVLVVAGCGSSNHNASSQPATTAATSSATEQSVCPSEEMAGIAADFGHRRSVAAAQKLAADAQRVGFQGLAVQRRGCDDFAVVLTGLRTMRQAKDFRKEADASGFHVTIECRSHPVEGGLAAVFGHRRTRRAAEKLQARAGAVGFRSLRVQQDSCGDWEVDLYGLKTPAQRHELAAEARRAGLHVTFELG
jgi:hypothetical protein